jgi:hypothetical protein
MTKEAAKAPLALLKTRTALESLIRLQLYWPVKFQSVANRTAITRAISTIVRAEDEYLSRAPRGLHPAGRRHLAVKHVLLLSDGRSLPDDFETLTKKMADAKITVLLLR